MRRERNEKGVQRTIKNKERIPPLGGERKESLKKKRREENRKKERKVKIGINS